MRCRRLIALAAILFATGPSQSAFLIGRPHHAASNANSPLGVNLAYFDYYNPEALALVDISKATDQFRTTIVKGRFSSLSSSPGGGMTIGTFDTNEESSVVIGSNYWPTAVTAVGKSFNALTLVLVNAQPSPYYPPGSGSSGTYDVYYSAGNCNLIYSQDVKSVSRNVMGGHDVIAVKPSANGIFITMTATGSGAGQCVISSVTYSAFTSSYLKGNCNTSRPTAQDCFTAAFLQFIAPFKTIRVKDWMCTDNNVETISSTWSTRPIPGMPFYSSCDQSQTTYGQNATIPQGVPAELLCALANYGNFDIQVAMPALASTSYATGMATLFSSCLNSNLHVYVAYSNETWNGIFSSYGQMQTLGNTNFGCGANFTCGRSWYGYMASQMAQAWIAVMGSSRVVGLIEGQLGVPATWTEALACVSASSPPCTTGISAVSSAPTYFGPTNEVPSAWTANSDGGLGCLFYNIGIAGQTCGTGFLPAYAAGNTTSGTASALKLASGQSLSGTPANGTCVSGHWNVTPNNGATLAVDSVTATALTDNAGNNVSNSLASSGGWFTACYTSATSAGSVTPSWRILYNQGGGGSSSGWLAESEARVFDDISAITTDYPSLSYVNYEGGPSFTNPLNIAVVQTLLNNANADSRMATATSTLYKYAQTTEGTHNASYYNDAYAGGFGLVTSYCASSACSLTTAPTSVKYGGIVSYINAHPKSWTLPYLLKRDLNPANDDSPAFMNEVA